MRDEAESDAAFFGLTLDREAPEEFGLWRDNLPALEAFFEVSNQWRVTPHFGARPTYQGLDYAACRAAWKAAGIAVSPEVWADVRAIEAGAMKELNSE